MKILITILFAASLCACSIMPPKSYAHQIENSQNSQDMKEVLFLVKFDDDSKFDTDEILIVNLYDGGLMDAPMKSIATFTEVTDKNYGPRAHITGRLQFQKKDFEKLSMPSFSARLEKNGKLIAINTSSQPYSGKTLAETIIINRIN